jgi:hypothetical protein
VPLLSLQQADAISLLSVLLGSGGVAHVLQSAASTSISELRESPLVFLGGCNDDWAFGFRTSFRFLPEPAHAIGDSAHPGTVWPRDLSKSYSSSKDDYAIIARFHNLTTDSKLVLLTGIARNGTEAAASWPPVPITCWSWLTALEQRLARKNIEAVIKINVIEEQTGAPAIQAVRVW